MGAREHVLTAAGVLTPDGIVRGGALVIVAGRVHSVRTSLRAARRVVAARTVIEDAGDVLLAPAFVDAHAHLELSAAGGAISARGEFPDWIRRVIAWRVPRTTEELAASATEGARRLLASGTTVVGDIDSSGSVARAARALPLIVRAYREVLDAGDTARTASALARHDELRAGARGPRDRWFEGLSPHAPYTVSPALWDELARRARRTRPWIAIHFAETQAEGAWLTEGSGPFAALLAHAPRRTGLDAIAGAGCLGPRTLLVHANHASAEERARIARAGAAVAHCPGTHAFFGRAPFDARAWLDAGVRLCLGTDSRASNVDLDMGRELALFAASQPRVTPAEAFACATSTAAAALGFAGRAGEFAPGAWADAVAYAVAPPRGGTAWKSERALEAVVRGAAPRRGTWARGRLWSPVLDAVEG